MRLPSYPQRHFLKIAQYKILYFCIVQPSAKSLCALSFRIQRNGHSCMMVRRPTYSAIDLRKGVARYIDYYNTRRYHQGIDHQIPAARYAAAIAA